MQATHYRGSVDGDIKEYLIRTHTNGAVCPTFQGYEPFRQLLDMGVVAPHITSIRLMFNIGRSDEHYYVIDEENAEGVSLKAHSGKEGIHNIEELLTTTKADYWEISGLDPKAFR